ncbi:MAG: tyrosine-protein phosphatase [Pseudomonadota bacterium]
MDHLPRKLDFEGAHNFRDMGGYPLTSGHRVRDGWLFRSDHLGRLTDADQTLLDKVGVRTVIDLRRQEERDEILDRIDNPDVNQIWLPVSAEAADVVTLRRSLERGEMGPDDAVEFLRLANRQFVELFSDVFSEFLHLLLDETHYPIVFHCSAGKDRVGFAAAMTLFALGADEDTVMHDYLATNHITANYVDGLIDGVMEMPGYGKKLTGQALRKLMQVEPDYLGGALQIMQAQYGSVHAYLEEGLGLKPEKRAQLQQLLLEPSA